MGSPLSSFLAEAVICMQDLEKRSVTGNKDIKTWKRYVDDVLATVKKDKTDDILHSINNTTENIRFTNEEEHNNQIAFLDVLLTRTNDGTINTQVYRKKTHTDQILNFNSNHPTQHKIICITTYLTESTHIVTQNKQSKANRTQISIFSFHEKYSYPRNFINKVLTKIRNKQRINKPNEQPTK